MPPRKTSKDDQPELPLSVASADAASGAAAPAAPDAGGGARPPAPPDSPAASDGAPGPGPEAPLARSYREWFLEYASYVILDRAVPHIDDGLKPVQRRILHTFWEQDDGRFHKVANIVGACMRFHPHGDASIGAALVGMGQRGFLVEPQGNFGNVLTGDEAAAPRYIEARLTAFAREVVFNPKTTTWQLSYDGRAKEPVTLPAKFPLVLLDGAELVQVAYPDLDDADATTRRAPQAVEGAAEQSHAGLVLALVDALGHLPRVDARLDETGRKAQRPRRGVAVAEAAGVRHDRGIEAAGDVAVDEIDADQRRQGIENDRHLLAHGGGGEVDEIDVAGRDVDPVVVDPAVDAAAGGVGEAAAEPLDLRGVDDDGGVKDGVEGDAADDTIATRQPGERRGVGLVVVEDDVAAEATQRTGQRERRAGDVAVGSGVAADEHPLRGHQDSGDGIGPIAGAVGEFAGEAAEGFASAVHSGGV